METRNIEIIVQEEEQLEKILNIIEQNKLKYAYILHDRDVNEETGELKKEHYHIQIYNKSAKTISAWAKLFNLEEHQIQKIKNKIKAIQYLIHKNDKSKAQYEKKEIESNIDLNKYLMDEQNETRDVMLLIRYIDKNKEVTLKTLLKFALENDIWASYRRNYAILRDYIYENYKY